MTDSSPPHTTLLNADVQKVVHHSAVYGIGVVLRRMGSIIMLPIYTRFLSTEEYGTVELLGISIDIVALILGLGLNASVFRFCSRAATEGEKRQIVSTVHFLMMGASLFGALTGVALAPHISQIVFSSTDQTYFVRIVFTSFFFLGVSEIGMTALQARHESARYVRISMMQLVIQLSVIVYLLVFRQMGIMGVLLGNLTAFACSGTYLVWVTLRWTGVQFSRTFLRPLFRYSIPLVFDNIAAFIMAFGDRYFLNHMSSTAEVGLYALSYKFGFMILYMLQPFHTFWAVERFEVAKRQDASSMYRRYFLYYLATLLFFALGLSVLAKDAIRIMAAPEFHPAYRVIWILVTAYVIHGLAAFCMIGVLVEGKTEQITISTWFAAAVCLVMNFVLVPRYHSYGAAIATIVPFSLRYVLVLRFSQRLLPVAYDWGAAARLVGIYGVLLAVALYVDIESIPLSIAFNVCLIGVMPVAIYFSGVLTAGERQQFIQLVSHPRATMRALRQGPAQAD